MITGKLLDDSPSLISKVKRSFTPEQMQTLSDTYRDLCTQKNILEENNWRESGVNFNPRPARILEILASDAELFSFPLVLKTFQYLANKPIEPSNELTAIEMAILLDDIRHLRYQKDRQSCYQSQQKKLEKIIRDYPESALVFPTLLAKLQKAIQTYQKHLEIETPH